MVFPFCFILRAILFHSNELSANFVETFDDATTLFRPRSLDAVSIMAELVLIRFHVCTVCWCKGNKKNTFPQIKDAKRYSF